MLPTFINSDSSPHFINPTAPLSSTVFFNLHIYSRNEKQTLCHLSFYKDGWQNFSNEVAPGNTLETAISHCLKEEFGMESWKFYHPIEFSDDTTDDQGNPVQRVNVFVETPFFTITGKKVLGMDTYWVGISEEKPQYVRALKNENIETLGQTLEIKINTESVDALRSKYPGEPITFWSLLENNISPELTNRYIGDDIHWDADYIFHKIKEGVPNLQLEYLPEEYTEIGDRQRFVFNALGKKHYVEVESPDIEPVFNYINNLMADFHQKFINIDILGDSISYLLVSSATNEEKLKSIIYTSDETESV